MRFLTLLTDFGVRDWFVASMKGVILGLAPRVQIVDITHEIPPQDVRAGAFVLSAATPALPKGTIHVAVVDPGVGSRRKALAVRTGRFVFLGPDNGLLSLALQSEKVIEMRALENERLFRHPVSHTFHGRDLFASVAGHLARGIPFSRVGPPVKSIVTLPSASPRKRGDRVHGEVVYIDRFGNLITNLCVERFVSSRTNIRIGRRRIPCISKSYSAVSRGSIVAVRNSCGLLEIGVRDGNAAERLPCKTGTPVSVVH